LPEDILARLSTVHTDVGSAIVQLVEKRTPAKPVPIRSAEVTRYGNRAVIIVTPGPTLRRLRGVQLVPVGNGRALISLAASTPISSLELQVRDALENMPPQNRPDVGSSHDHRPGVEDEAPPQLMVRRLRATTRV
jgi:hypothetical protein